MDRPTLLRPELMGARLLEELELRGAMDELPRLDEDGATLRLDDEFEKLRLDDGLAERDGALFMLRDGAELREDGVAMLRLGAGLALRVGAV